MEPTLLELVLMVGFAARLTRLVAVDDAGVLVRTPMLILAAAALGRDRGTDWALRLLQCPFCVGFWLSALVVGSWALAGTQPVWVAVAGVFTLNYVHGHLNRVLDGGDDD
jgi:hypothetical protein